jgi:uncharacterized membrane protein SirB2
MATTAMRISNPRRLRRRGDVNFGQLMVSGISLLHTFVFAPLTFQASWPLNRVEHSGSGIMAYRTLQLHFNPLPSFLQPDGTPELQT